MDPGLEDIGIDELSEMSVKEAKDISDTEEYSEGYASRVLSGPDTAKWQDILMSNTFADELYLMDEIFSDNSYSGEMHVGRDSFRQVEYDSFPRPEPLRLMVANEYSEFMENVSHPLFDRMEKDEWRRPSDSSVEIGFDSYEDTESVDLGLDSMDIHVPTFIAYNSAVFQDSFGPNQRYRSLDP